jgi:hypothetical protein
LTWVERNREQIENIRAYVLGFQNVRPPVFRWFQGGAEPVFPWAPQSDRGTAMLLFFCALYQNIREEKLIRFLAYLWKEYDKDVFRLNKVPFAELQERVQRLTDLSDWVLWSKVPGVLRSVCDFFFRHGRLLPWVQVLGDGEKAIEILSDEIFMMGKTSVFKSKPRYFLWLLTQMEGVKAESFWGPKTRLPITPGQMRLLREFGPLKNRKRAPWSTPEEKLGYCNRFFRFLVPERPWSVYTALDAYLKPNGFSRPSASPQNPDSREERKWLCRDVLGGCLQCALVANCPGREPM